MPAQDLQNCGPSINPPLTEPNGKARIALTAIVALTSLASCGFAVGLYQALALHNGGTAAHYLFLALSTITFAWMSFGAATALVGAIATLAAGARPDTVELTGCIWNCSGERTALIFPVFQEDPELVAASILSLVQQLKTANVLSDFDIFVLSDSQTVEARKLERVIFSDLAMVLHDEIAVVYRNRPHNIGKKAENIADWVRTFGGNYPYFVVFDADSIMSANTLRRLVATIQANPGTGLIQTVPRLIGARTLFGHLQQFANNLFGPVSAAGFACFQGASGNYWGHNAIIRTSAFASCAGLPILSGVPPFGGHVRSHDFVEAALMRRAGWAIAIATSLDGSYEGCPPTLIETAIRDRRWMQGNLQHIAVLTARGLTRMSRCHLLLGIFSYLSSVLWLAMLSTGLWLMAQEQDRLVNFFDNGQSLFPNWPTFDPEAGLRVLAATCFVVFLPKLLGLVVNLVRPSNGQLQFKRIPILLAGWLYELILGALMAPIFMLLHVQYLIEIILGRDSGWIRQERMSTGVSMKDALRFHKLHVLTGLVLVLATATLSWHAVAWFSPLILGLVLSPALTHYTSRSAHAFEKRLLSTRFATMDEARLDARRAHAPVRENHSQHRAKSDPQQAMAA